MRIILHGGAGTAPDSPAERQAILDDTAARAVVADTPLDAVETALRRLEADPRFNAGVGGAIQSDGVVRTDAGVMTSDREAGAVAGLAGVRNAVTVARAVHSETPHVLLAGDPALAFAADVGVSTDVDLTTDHTRARFADADPPEGSPRDHLAWLRDRFGGTSATTGHDTVGAVASDGETVAAATSTAGRWFALAGRVGDVPQVGNGFYCAPAGGASATGAGEAIAKATLARRAVRALEAGHSPQAAADRAIASFAELTGSTAGVVVHGRDGVASAYNSEAMQTSVARS